MTDQRPFRVEVVVDAPREEVWRALTEPERVARWFGWDYDGLESEIRYIFVDHARQEPPGLLVLDDGEDNQTIELVDEGPRTRVICVRPGSLDGADWDELYEDVREGWITFFNQLRFYLEHHPGEERRTLHFPEAPDHGVLDALAGEELYRTPHQVGLSVDAWNDAMLVVYGRGRVIVSTYGLDETRLAEIRERFGER
jgi:uncharacterized protein YndB with AHSA1/START domain